MIAIPIKIKKETCSVSTLFGKAKYFALINNNIIEIVKNEQTSGKAVAAWLKSKNVNILITSHMREKPFSSLLNDNIQVYLAKDKEVEINKILLQYADGELPILDKESFNLYFKKYSFKRNSNSKIAHKAHY
ncbi:[Fe-Mo] cluster-binding protein, NifX/NifB/NifY family [Arcobacter venerupis]|uniref:[Fe-Mo] cluster-binding protein, NifX/NifB/NifY family n=1 Tax=Arcobacter venerupis TaxID=1054033 RepID=A0AAE7BB29_9BACT|nr:NifB/NifX family molybdenum-iron cluster-binding protein [Arcobacter venerupis]QKF67230.1 [Fe-Mo] cluster-binding protein, NifX/NifB/NifY family [Arcobacter venerupis]RWS48440.1 dinitrogenase [Arcobacter venerupis]